MVDASSALMRVGQSCSICAITITTYGVTFWHCRSCLIKQQSVLIESIALTRSIKLFEGDGSDEESGEKNTCLGE